MSLSTDDMKYFDGKFEGLHSRITDLTTNGCSKASLHLDHEGRLRVVEHAQNVSEGKGMVIAVVISAAISIAAILVQLFFKGEKS